MPRTDVNIYKRKDGRWEGRYIKGRRNGKAWYGAVYAHSYQEVKVKLGIAKEALARDAVRASAGTVSAVGEAWLSEAAVSLKDSSLNKYEDILRCYIIPHFGDCELSDITNEQLMGFGNALLTEGGANSQGLSASTVREVMSAMNSLRIHALRRDCSVSFTTECVNIKRDTEEIRVFTLQEEERLVAWLCGHFDLTAMVILLCLFTGIRVGEACALTWDDFDFGQGVFHVRKTMQRIRIKGDPEKKTEVRIIEPKSDCSVRTIPIPDNLRELLLSNRAEGAFLMTGDKKEFVEPRTLQNRFKSILKKAGIADANFHTTRHTFATRCVEQGFDIKCLSEILGHANVSITLNRYVHPSLGLKTENMAKLSGLFPIDGVTEDGSY